MLDAKFYNNKGPFSLSKIVNLIDCSIVGGDDSQKIYNVASLTSATKDDITFIANTKYLKFLSTTNAAACIIEKKYIPKATKKCLLVSNNPYYSYSKAINLFYSPKKTTEQSNNIASNVLIGDGSTIGRNTVICDDVSIGKNVIIGSNSYIGQGVTIGDNCNISNNTTIECSIIHDNVKIDSGARIGQQGFGFAIHNSNYYDIFHIGRVIINDNVSIGANTTIDRGSLEDTVIGSSCRIDNLIQIAHNVKICKGCVIAAQTCIAGSTIIGNYCMIGIKVGIVGHLVIGDYVKIFADSLVIKDIPNSITVGGMPALDAMDWHRQTIMLKKLIKK